MKELLHPYDASGTQIDAAFSVDQLEGGRSALHFASRGGTKGTTAARNSQYHVGLTIVLIRLKELGATITDVLLDSAAARTRPAFERRLNLPPEIRLPIHLPEIADVDAFRRVVQEAQRNVLAAPGRNAKHGNRVRRIQIQFSLPSEQQSLLREQIAHLLRGDQAMLPTADLVELKSRTARLRSRGRLSMPAGNPTPTVIEFSSAKRYLRLPSVVLYVLQRADGKCELCEKTTFVTDVGDPYLEIHHVIQLANGGPDTPQNAVALCPDCHRELHHGVERARRVALLYQRVPELLLP
jgi:5-methylcytosine-specific restriction endonuclease McrA